MGTVLDEICKAIEQSNQTRYAISKATGIDQAQLSKLMKRETGLSLQRLLDHLELEIKIQPKAKRRKKGKK
jgi:methylphosphotriester-DNA--protein-cysteine methyltransferase